MVAQIVLMLLLAVSAHAMNVQLDWDASPDANVTGYKVHYASAVTYQSVDVGSTLTHSLYGLPEHRYWFAATAYDADGNESIFSNVIRVSEIADRPVRMMGTKATLKVGGRKIRVR